MGFIGIKYDYPVYQLVPKSIDPSFNWSPNAGQFDEACHVLLSQKISQIKNG